MDASSDDRPPRGGARSGAGRKPTFEDVRKTSISLDSATATMLRRLGKGHLSAGIRMAASIAAASEQGPPKEEAPQTATGLAQAGLHPMAEQSTPRADERVERIALDNPGKVVVHECHGRHVSAFASPGYFALKESIRHSGGNRVPVLLVGRGGGHLELVYGRLRLQAATELDLPLLALVRESRWGANLFDLLDMAIDSCEAGMRWSMYERGTMAKRCLELGYYPSRRRLAEHLGWGASEVTDALSVVNWPTALTAAFPSPRDIEQKWIARLAARLERDPSGLIATARGISSESRKRSAKDVYSALLGSSKS